MNKFNLLLLIFLLGVLQTVQAQQQQQPRKNDNWFHMDPEQDRFAGVSADRTYDELLKDMIPDTVIVAVLDGGTDINHPDLSANIWINKKEIAGNGIDDDSNGYTDDMNGWNFLGSSKGTINKENLEITRQYRNYLKAKAAGLPITPEMKHAAKAYPKEVKSYSKMFAVLKELKNSLAQLEKSAGTDSITITHIRNFAATDKNAIRIKNMMISEIEAGTSYYDLRDQLLQGHDQVEVIINYNLNLEYEARSIIGDDPENYADRSYGNNDVIGGSPEHGTHVAGIIGAIRNNNIGVNGIASAVKIMVVRTVPDGDEYDKDVANAIRYAVDNGARVINMSFGKDLSPGKKVIDEAMSYAASKDVLLVHAAGNDSKNIDKGGNYPNKFINGTNNRIPGWLEVGANSSSGDAGRFSNYGRKTVDLFAPGVNIYSTVPGDAYKNENGTSMAAPMVSGVAAILRSYFPQLTAEQIRNILLASVTKVPFDTTRPGSKKKAGFNELCVTGGIVNAYKAVEMAKGIAK
jgi:subtilisin family serine protease